MARKIGLLGVTVCLVLGLVVSSTSLQAIAQEEPHAHTIYLMNMRSGPGATYATVTSLEPNTPLYLEARTEDNQWVLGRTVDSAYRGWLASLYLAYTPGFSAFNLPVSGEIVSAGAAAPASDAPPDAPPPAPAEAASGGVRVRANSQMNVRSGPGTTYQPVGLIDAGVNLVLEARNFDSTWVLGRTDDSTVRGWVYGLYLAYLSGSVSSLPVSDEHIAGSAPEGGSSENPAAPTITGTNPVYQGEIMGPLDPAVIEGIDLTAYPVVGRATGRAREIFLQGRAMGNNPNVIAKVGDCSTEHWFFLNVFNWGQYNLGAYQDLQGVIDHFGESLAYGGEASSNGYNANVVGGPEWSNPAACEKGESPLLCEYRLHKPSVSIIMFGTSDLLVMTPYEFDFYMRSIVDQTIELGIIPILSTFPSNLNFWNRTLIFNQIVVRIALDYDLPLINLWLALESLPNHGVESDGFHLGVPLTSAGDLTEPNLQTGYPTRNLVTLQTLDNVWRGAMQ